jgi:hypothetical protein
MKLVRYVWWPLVLVTSVAAWWGVAYWLEPKPLWVIPEGEQVYVSSYDPVLKRLGVYQRFSLSDSTGQMLILDAPTGNCIAKKTIRIEPWLEQGANIDVTPRLGKNDTYWRFAQERKGDGSSELQLRCWSYLKSIEEEIIASWPIPSTKGLEESNSMRVPMTAVWLPGEPDSFVVSHTLPTHRLIQAAASFLVPNILAKWSCDVYYWERSLVKCDVWHIDHAHRSATITNTYLAPFALQPLYYQERSDKDRIHHVSVQGNYTREASLLWINGKTGKIDRQLSLKDGDRGVFDFKQSGLLFLRRQLLTEVQRNGQLAYQCNDTPSRIRPNKWTLDTWRPLLDPETWKPVAWPAELDVGIVGSDMLLANQLDPTRLLYRSQTYDDNPQWQNTNTSKTTTHFVFLRYINGQLTLEKRWHNDEWMNCIPQVYTDQLFVQGDQPGDQRSWAMYLWEKFPSWANWYQTKIVKAGSSFVAAVEIDTGTTLWKRKDREFDPHLPLLGTDFMLVKFSRVGAPATGCECYALPMKIYSPWWPPGVAALVLVIAVCLSLRHRRAPTLPTGSPA